jgi:hypothetical protein
VSAVREELTPPDEAEGHTPGRRSPGRCRSRSPSPSNSHVR